MERTWSLTIGNGGENHTGMEFLGNLRKKGDGWNVEKLIKAKNILENIFEKKVDMYNLNEICLEGIVIPQKCEKPKDAYLMVVRNFLSENVHKNFKKELSSSFYTCLRNDVEKKQKWPLVNLIRQFLKHYKYQALLQI